VQHTLEDLEWSLPNFPYLDGWFGLIDNGLELSAYFLKNSANVRMGINIELLYAEAKVELPKRYWRRVGFYKLKTLLTKLLMVMLLLKQQTQIYHSKFCIQFIESKRFLQYANFTINYCSFIFEATDRQGKNILQSYKLYP
jgi:hypothetical protein